MDRLAALPHDTVVTSPPAALEQAASVPANGHLTLVTSLAGLLALEENWRELEKNAQTLTAFQTFDWISAWCRTYCASGTCPEIHVIAGFNNDRLAFVWPLMKVRRAGLNVLCWLTEPFGQYGDVVCAKGECARLWVANALRFIRRFKEIDILRLRHVRNDSTLASVAAHELVNARLDEKAPYLDLSQFAAETDYENRYSGTQRKRRKKIRKHLEELGPVTFSRVPLGTISDAAVAEAIVEKNKWLGERGRINQVMHCPFHLDFLKTLARGNQETLAMVVTELRAGDKPVSWEISFRTGGTHFAYITSHRNELTDLSPGRLHFDLSQRGCLADGMKVFDLMVPYDAHKESWSSACMPTQDYYLPLSGRGNVAGTLYLSHLRPLLRAAYYRLPQSVLRYINPLRARSTE